MNTSLPNSIRMDLFEELRPTKSDQVIQSVVDQEISSELFLGNTEKLNRILKEKSSVRIEIDVGNQDEENMNDIAKSSPESPNNLILKSISAEKEVAEMTINAAKEDEREALETDEIYKYIDRENSNRDNNDTKLFK